MVKIHRSVRRFRARLCHTSTAAASAPIRWALQTVLLNCEDVVFDVAAFSTFLLDHLANRLDRVEPRILLRFGLECRCSDEVALVSLQHFALHESFSDFFGA